MWKDLGGDGVRTKEETLLGKMHLSARQPNKSVTLESLLQVSVTLD